MFMGFSLFFCANTIQAECRKGVDCREIIEQALKEYFETALVNGEKDAPVDWCYYENCREVFLLLSQPLNSLEALRKTMRDIGEKVMDIAVSKQRMEKQLSTFEKMAVHKGFIVRAMAGGMILPNGSLAIYIQPKHAS